MAPQVSFLGTGRSVPAKQRRSEFFDAELGLETGTLFQATGVAQRYVSQSESQIDLAIAAIENAIDAAGISAQDIDLVISACGVGYQAIPSTAPLVMAHLGVQDGAAAAFDVNSTCLSFLTGVETAHHLIATGQHKTAVVFSSELASRALPWATDAQTAALFGDGAAAAILGQKSSAGRGLVAHLMKTYPSAYDACTLAAGGTRFDVHKQPVEFAQNTTFHMDGKALFRFASKYLKGFFDELLERANWTTEDVDVVIPHQASPLALQHMIKATGVDPGKVIDITQDYGNQIAASIPFAFDLARRDQRLGAGSKILFLGTSAGVSLGGIAWEM